MAHSRHRAGNIPAAVAIGDSTVLLTTEEGVSAGDQDGTIRGTGLPPGPVSG